MRSFHDTLDLHADNALVHVEYFFLPCSVQTILGGGLDDVNVGGTTGRPVIFFVGTQWFYKGVSMFDPSLCFELFCICSLTLKSSYEGLSGNSTFHAKFIV